MGNYHWPLVVADSVSGGLSSVLAAGNTTGGYDLIISVGDTLEVLGSTSGIDHGDLDGLSDDDHTQYLTEARHDALAADNPHSVTWAQSLSAGSTSGATSPSVDAGQTFSCDTYNSTTSGAQLFAWDNSNSAWIADENFHFQNTGANSLSLSELAVTSLTGGGRFNIESEEDIGTTNPLFSLTYRPATEVDQFTTGIFSIERQTGGSAPSLVVPTVFEINYTDLDGQAPGSNVYDVQLYQYNFTQPTLSASQFRNIRAYKLPAYSLNDGGTAGNFNTYAGDVFLPQITSLSGTGTTTLYGYSVDAASSQFLLTGAKNINIHHYKAAPVAYGGLGNSGTVNQFPFYVEAQSHGVFAGTSVYTYAGLRLEAQTITASAGTVEAYAIWSSQTQRSFFEGSIFIGDDNSGAFTTAFNDVGNDLGVEGIIECLEDIVIGGALNHDGSTIGFFATTPATQAGTTADIKDALTTYGLLQGTSATPLDLDGGDLTAGTVNVEDELLFDEEAKGNQSGSVTIDWTTNPKKTMTLTGNVTSLAMTEPTSNTGVLRLWAVQDGTGGYTISGWDSKIKWAGGVTPGIATGASQRTLYLFEYSASKDEYIGGVILNGA